MSRFAEALRRAAGEPLTRAGDGATGRSDEPSLFFAPGQPTVVAPWTLGTDAAMPATQIDRAAPPQADPPLLRHAAEPGSDRADLAWSPDDVGEKLVVSTVIPPLVRERYVKLAAVLHQAHVDHEVKVVLITSATSGEGKTLTS